MKTNLMTENEWIDWQVTNFSISQYGMRSEYLFALLEVYEGKQDFTPIKVGHYRIFTDGNKTILLNIETGKLSIAKCHEDDSFNLLKGVAICWAKYCNRALPYCILIR